MDVKEFEDYFFKDPDVLGLSRYFEILRKKSDNGEYNLEFIKSPLNNYPTPGRIYGKRVEDEYTYYAFDKSYLRIDNFINAYGWQWEAYYCNRTQDDVLNEMQHSLDAISFVCPVVFYEAQAANVVVDILRGNEIKALQRANLLLFTKYGEIVVGRMIGRLAQKAHRA